MKSDFDDAEPEQPWHSLWGAVYGNLMSCIALFFMLMFISSKSIMFQAGIDAVAKQFGGLKSVRKTNDFSSFGVEEIARLDIKENRMRITFGDPVLFDSGRASLKPTALTHLDRLAAAFKLMPNPIQVEGHTDDHPVAASSPFHSNWELSAARAFSVLQYLQKQGVPPARLSAIGYGEWKPLRPNDSPEHRAINRRIEIVIVRMEE